MMLALEMFRSLPRTVAGRAVGARLPGLLSGYAAPLRLVTLDAPRVARPGWARLRTRLSGICGSDLAMLSGQTSLYFSAVVSLPFVPGHEVVAELLDDCEDLPAGTRVVLDPVLGLRGPRRRAVRVLRGAARPTAAPGSRSGRSRAGLQTGFCHDTGGGWGQQLVAHRSQLHPVPDEVDDVRALLLEPLACAVHTALRAGIRADDRVLVSGAGLVGLLTTFALRALTPAGEMLVVAKHPHQRALARVARRQRGRRPRGGAPAGAPRHRRLPGAARARLAVPARRRGRRGRRRRVRGRPWRPRCTPPGRAGAWCSPGCRRGPTSRAAWFRELEVVGSYASAVHEPGAEGPWAGRSAFEIATGLLGRPGAGAGGRRGRPLPAAPLARGPRPRPRRRPARHRQGGLRPPPAPVSSAVPAGGPMSRPGFVLEVDDRTPPLVVHEGLGFRLERFPLGTRVVYPPESLPVVPDVDEAIREALLHPVDADPLPTLLRPGMRLTIAFDDLSLPLPPMRAPDIRGRIIEHVLTLAAEAGVDDVALVAANALHRRMTAAELRHIVGERVFRSFHPQGLLTNFDAEDPRRPGPPRHHRAGRGRRDQPPRRRVGPARLRQRQPRRDGRRAQVGGDRAGVVPLAAPPPQRAHDGALALVHGPHPLGAAPVGVADGAADQGARAGLPDRDDARQRRLPAALRLLPEARVGVVGARPGDDARGQARPRAGPAAAAAPALPRPARRLRADRRRGGRGRGRARADARSGCTASSWSRCRASPTCWCSGCPTSGPTTSTAR